MNATCERFLGSVRRECLDREDCEAEQTLAQLTQRVREMLQPANRTESG